MVYKIKNSKGNYIYANPELIINGSVNWMDSESSGTIIIDDLIINIECDTENKHNLL